MVELWVRSLAGFDKTQRVLVCYCVKKGGLNTLFYRVSFSLLLLEAFNLQFNWRALPNNTLAAQRSSTTRSNNLSRAASEGVGLFWLEAVEGA